MSLDKITMANGDVLGQELEWLQSGRGAVVVNEALEILKGADTAVSITASPTKWRGR